MNACIAVETGADPRELLAAAKRIEMELGRDPDASRHAPRRLDIDVLIVEGEQIDTPDYHVPHTEMGNRRFVLEPLLDLDPPNRVELEAALQRVAGQRVTRFGTL